MDPVHAATCACSNGDDAAKSGLCNSFTRKCWYSTGVRGAGMLHGSHCPGPLRQDEDKRIILPGVIEMTGINEAQGRGWLIFFSKLINKQTTHFNHINR